MVKRCVLIGLVLVLLAGFTVVVGCGGEAGAAGNAAKRYLEEAETSVPVESVEVLEVEITDEHHAIVKVRVEHGYIADPEGMSIEKVVEDYTVYMEKYGDEWEFVSIK